MTRVGPVHLILESLSKPEQSCTLQLLHLHLFRSTHACSGGVNGAGVVTSLFAHDTIGVAIKGPLELWFSACVNALEPEIALYA